MPGLSRSSSTRDIHDQDALSESPISSGRQLSDDSPSGGDRRLSMTTRLLRSKSALVRAQQNIESIESLVVNAAVITALLLSFVVANVIGNYKDGDWDRATFKDALYGWPNRGFQEFVIRTLWQEGVNMTVELDLEVLNLADAIRALPIQQTKWSGTGPGQSADHEIVVELVFPQFPRPKMKAWFVRHADEFDDMATLAVASWFFQLTTLAILMATVAFVAALASYISLTLSGARSDMSGRVLNEWCRFGVPTTLFIYGISLIALALYLSSIGAAVWNQDVFVIGSGELFMNWMVKGFLPLSGAFVAMFALSLYRGDRAHDHARESAGRDAAAASPVAVRPSPDDEKAPGD